jgi:hypothetical protein
VEGVAPHFAPAAIPIPAGNPQWVTWDRDDIRRGGSVPVEASVPTANFMWGADTAPDPQFIEPASMWQPITKPTIVPLRSYGPDPFPAIDPDAAEVAQLATKNNVARRRVGSTQYRQIGWPRVVQKWPWQR